MDDKEKELDEILNRMREGLRNYQESESQSGEPYLKIHDDYGIDFSDTMIDSISITGDGSGYPNVTIASGHTWTGTNTISPNVYISPNTWSTLDDITIGKRQSGKITLQGDEADIDINGRSLTKTLDAIQERLAMLVPDANMETEWADLRAIREQYEAKLQECREKSRMWKTLKDMPPPEVK